MSKWWTLLIVVILAMALQMSFLPVYLLAEFKPDLLLIIIVFIALRGLFGGGLVLAWSLGLLKDVFSGLYLGLNAFSFLIIYLLIKNISARLYSEGAKIFVVAVSIATLVVTLSNLILLTVFTNAPGIAFSIVAEFIPHLLINIFIASLVSIIPGISASLETT